MNGWMKLMLWTMLPSSAWAASPQISLSLAGGATFMDALEVIDTTYTQVSPRVAYSISPNLALEFDMSYLMGETRLGTPEPFPYSAMTPRLGFLGTVFEDKPVNLLLTMSFGAFIKTVDDEGALDLPVGDQTDVDVIASAGPGFRVPFGPQSPLALRVDGRYLLNIGTENYENRGDVFLSWETTAGLMYTIGGPKDADLDGIEDEEDGCPDVAEDIDNFEDHDGCPEADNDQDTVLDVDDACPNEAEDADGFEDENGCPDSDNDGDGLLDVDDTCPDEAGSEKAAGCPDADNDMLADSEDECPDEAGALSAYGCPDGDEDGVPDHRDECPEEAAPVTANKLRSNGCAAIVYISDNALVVTEKIQFSSGRATIRRASHGLLDKIAAVLERYPGIKKLQVKGYTDSDGDDTMNLDLSQARVDAVVAYLVEEGIETGRLEAKGYGEVGPIGDNATSDGKAMNRRVEFEILSQDVAQRAKRRLKGKVEKVEEAASE